MMTDNILYEYKILIFGNIYYKLLLKYINLYLTNLNIMEYTYSIYDINMINYKMNTLQK